MYKNILFNKLKKKNIIYLLIIIIFFCLLSSFKHEGFIPYLNDKNDIKNYCIKSPTGLFQTPTIINQYQCNNKSPNIVPIINTIDLNIIKLNNNLCPFDTKYINASQYN